MVFAMFKSIIGPSPLLRALLYSRTGAACCGSVEAADITVGSFQDCDRIRRHTNSWLRSKPDGGESVILSHAPPPEMSFMTLPSYHGRYYGLGTLGQHAA